MCIVCFEIAELTPNLHLKLGDVGVASRPACYCLRSNEAASDVN